MTDSAIPTRSLGPLGKIAEGSGADHTAEGRNGRGPPERTRHRPAITVLSRDKMDEMGRDYRADFPKLSIRVSVPRVLRNLHVENALCH